MIWSYIAFACIFTLWIWLTRSASQPSYEWTPTNAPLFGDRIVLNDGSRASRGEELFWRKKSANCVEYRRMTAEESAQWQADTAW